MIEPDLLVSVVIPTRHRSDLVVRAVGSALNQTFQAMEVIVVVEGPDEETVEALGAIQDPRLRINALPSNLGRLRLAMWACGNPEVHGWHFLIMTMNGCLKNWKPSYALPTRPP